MSHIKEHATNKVQSQIRPPLLHYHGDGSKHLLPILPELFRMSGKPFPFSIKGYENEVQDLFKCAQIDIVEKFMNTTGIMQSRETLSLTAYAVVIGLSKEGFTYVEITFAPQYHVFGGMTEHQVITALIEGIQIAEKEYPQMEANLIFTIGREVSPEEAVRLVDVASTCDRKYVVGIGLACNEAENPPEKHIPMFRRARELGFKTTCHAGEWVSTPPSQTQDIEKYAEKDQLCLLKNVRTAILDLQVDRIGHAIPLAYNEEIMQLAINNNVSIEGCPASNLSSNLIPNLTYLRVRDILSHNITYCVNPDDDLFMPDFDETMALLDATYHFTTNELQKLETNAWAMRFGQRKIHLQQLTIAYSLDDDNYKVLIFTDN
jgi:adenosine deaminase